MPPLRPETKWSATLVQTFSVVAAVALAAWYVRGTLEQVLREIADLRRGQAELRADLDTRYVTQEQAERYAANFRWTNRTLNIEVPEPSRFKAP